MSHQRTNIRNALVSALSGHTDAGSHVFSNLSYNLQTSQLPAILVSQTREDAVPRDLQSKQFIRTLEMKLVILVQANSSYDTTLDALVLQVENILTSNRNISGSATSSIYISTEFNFDGSSEKTIATATMTYNIQYMA